MTERYPDDSTLLGLDQDADTGVEYIATGQSPYYLEFRKLIQRLLLAAQRANDLRVYQDGDLSVGVRPGRCVIADAAVAFAGTTGVSVTNNATTYLWLDSAGTAQSSTSSMPADRTTFVPLAEVVAAAGAITAITDRRAELFLAVPDPTFIGLTATAAEINQALDGINATVDVAALNTLTGGQTSTADGEHRHVQVYTDEDDETEFRLMNDNSGSSANILLRFNLPNILADLLDVFADRTTGWLMQRKASSGPTYAVIGTVHAAFGHEGDLTASQTGKLIGAVPIDGTVSDVILSVGTNIVSDTSTDGVSATAKVNGTALTSTDPQITDAEGSGFKSTAQDDGTAAVVKSDGTEDVSKGDVLTVDLTRTAAGTITTEAADVVAMVVIRPDKPE